MFMKSNSLKRFISSTESFFRQFLLLDELICPSVDDLRIDYVLLMKLFDFVMLTNPQFKVIYSVPEVGDKLELNELAEDLKAQITGLENKLMSATNPQYVKALKETLDRFKEQLDNLTKQNTSRSHLKENKTRASNLKKLYYFYCKQHVVLGQNCNSFQDLDVNSNQMSLANWMYFCKN